MTKQQADTIIAGIVAVIITQILCTAVLLRAHERARRAETVSAQYQRSGAVWSVGTAPRFGNLSAASKVQCD